MEIQQQGVGGVDGLDDAWAVIVSPDGKHVYATANQDLPPTRPGAVAVFSRNSTTGTLSFVEVQKDGIGGVDGLADAISMAFTPDGKRFFVAGQTDDAVAVFSRNTTTGSLTFLEVFRDGVSGVDGLDQPWLVVVSSDGKHLYVAGRNDKALAVFTVAGADLSIAEAASPNPAIIDQTLTYTITVNNNGPDTATTVTVTDTLPAEVSFVSASAGCNEAAGTVTCTAASLAYTASVQFTITVTAPDTTGAISSTASVSAASPDDPDSSDNSVTLVTNVGDPVADLSITKTANPSLAIVDQAFTYTITVTNDGPDLASSITVTDTLPPSVSFESASAGCAEADGTVECTADSLTNGDSVAFTITTIAPPTVGSISNTATVTSISRDLTSSNDSSTLVTIVTHPPVVPGVTTWGLGALALVLGALVLVARQRRTHSASW